MTKVKLCGMLRIRDITACNEIMPDYVGFVFWEKSKRNIDPEKAEILRLLLDKKIKVVGVFVDADVEIIKILYGKGIIQIAQLHGSETNEYIDELKEYGVPTIKAFKVDNEETIARAIKSHADYIMFDPGKGDGMTFNWELIKDVDREYFLAGGLNPENVAEAVEMLKPYAVDVSSGIETNGLKDEIKMAAFKENAKNEV